MPSSPSLPPCHPHHHCHHAIVTIIATMTSSPSLPPCHPHHRCHHAILTIIATTHTYSLTHTHTNGHIHTQKNTYAYSHSVRVQDGRMRVGGICEEEHMVALPAVPRSQPSIPAVLATSRPCCCSPLMPTAATGHQLACRHPAGPRLHEKQERVRGV